ncbi:thiamine ABC transporter substrate binding subunit [Mergibacter septicus]|uniref:thiamine ABC transporter substrate binding subunit n=1 Tax=Mergibacter septicus TaxID=221402 RepID=UPI001178FBFC|nr:thiamine ABC transporter substrate binding subunit [Mergibacter septicus]AWX13321.1 thiamine ABC transporter substrate binding subunit [Mergibacter septicus]
MNNLSKFLLSTFCVGLFSISTVFADKPSLNVYTYSSFGGKSKLKKAFEKKCGCEVKFEKFDDAILVFNKLRLDGNKSKADVLIGLDANLIDEAKKSGLFAANNLNLNHLQLPIKWTDQTFLPYDFGEFAFIYNQDKLKNPPKSLAELINRQDLKVIYQDPRTSSVGRGLLLWMNSAFPANQIADEWKKLTKHTVTVTKGWSEAYGAFLKGEADLVLSYNTSPLYHQLNENEYKYVATKFNQGGILQIEVAAKLKHSPHQKLADEFLAFLVSPEAQKIIALNNVMLPVVDVKIDAGYDQLRQQQLKVNVVDTTKINQAMIKKWLTTWQNALVD